MDGRRRRRLQWSFLGRGQVRLDLAAPFQPAPGPTAFAVRQPAPAVLSLGVILAALASIAADAPLPEGNAYVRELAARQRQRAEVLDTYTYDLISVREDLDAKGAVTRRRTRTYQTFFVGGRPVRRQVAEDGRALDGKQQARADREAEDRAQAIRKGEAAEEKPGARLLVILERSTSEATAARTSTAALPSCSPSCPSPESATSRGTRRCAT